jgi:large subunit ribosomal protein L29
MPSAKELRELTDEELESRLAESKAELFNLRFQLATGKQDNSARLGQVRKDVARALTILRQREIEAAEALEAAGEVRA